MRIDRPLHPETVLRLSAISLIKWGGMVVPQPLSHKPWFSGVYKRIYDIIAMENRLPPPDKILILDEPPEEIKSMKDGRLTYTYGAAIRDKMSIWFRYEPPDPYIYAHELAHLTNANIAPRIIRVFEEIYADSIARIALVFVNRNIKPSTNPARLFEDIDLKDIADAMRKHLRLRGEDEEVILQYYEIRGIIPLFADVKIYGGRSKIEIEDNHPREIITLLLLSSLINAISITKSLFKSKSPELNIILDLLNKLAGKEDNLLKAGTRRKKLEALYRYIANLLPALKGRGFHL